MIYYVIVNINPGFQYSILIRIYYLSFDILKYIYTSNAC